MNDVLPLDASTMPRGFPGRAWMLRWPLYHWLRHKFVHSWRATGDDAEAREIRRFVQLNQGAIEMRPSSSELARRYWDDALDCLARLARDCHVRGVPVVLVVFPSLPQMNRPDPLPEAQAELAALAEREGFILVDLLPRYAEAGEAALLPSDKSHPSPLGHTLAARELMAALEAAGVLPGR
jgi:hypothetical protein